MHMVLLTLHVLVASILVLATIGVLAAGWQRRLTRVYTVMLATLVGTLGSGTVMLFVGFGSIGRICAGMSAVTLASLIARHYYHSRQTSTV